MKRFSKALSLKMAAGAEITPEIMAKVREYTLTDIPAESLYVRRLLLAHNAIDRDGERFSDALLDDFVATLPGKGFLIGHRHGPPGEGRFFDASIEEHPLAEARAMTGEALPVPDGQTTVKFVRGWIYTVRNASREDLLADIDAGIANFVSIGFDASNLRSVVDEKTGDILYREYTAPGEAHEGSVVWLGAQPGAAFTKTPSAGDGDYIDEKKKNFKKKTKEINHMKSIFKKLGLGEDATEEQALKAIGHKDARLKSLEEVVEPLGENLRKDYVTSLMASAEAGKAYLTDLVTRQVKAERMLGRLSDTPEAVEARTKRLSGRAIDELKDDVAYFEKLVAEKHPAGSQIDGGSDGENRDYSKAGDDDSTLKKSLCLVAN